MQDAELFKNINLGVNTSVLFPKYAKFIFKSTQNCTNFRLSNLATDFNQIIPFLLSFY